MRHEPPPSKACRVRRRRVLLAWCAIAAGLAITGFAALVIAEFGFYLSGRGDVGQLEGGLLPLLLLIGVMLFAWGVVELWFHLR